MADPEADPLSTVVKRKEDAMNALSMDRVKHALIRELDVTFQREFRQSLSEVMTELRIRHTLSGPGEEPDQVLNAIRSSRMLLCNRSEATQRIRFALDRIAGGTFGICTRCGREIPGRLLEKNPTHQFCETCFGS
ncbi:MAG: hypothetical protein WD295_00885 [Bacteroidota bacterium]